MGIEEDRAKVQAALTTRRAAIPAPAPTPSRGDIARKLRQEQTYKKAQLGRLARNFATWMKELDIPCDGGAGLSRGWYAGSIVSTTSASHDMVISSSNMLLVTTSGKIRCSVSRDLITDQAPSKIRSKIGHIESQFGIKYPY